MIENSDVWGRLIKVAVAIPWRATPERQAAHNYVRNVYDRRLPSAPVYEVDAPGWTGFALAPSRDLGVRLAEGAGADVVVISDADAVPAASTLWDAIVGAYEEGGLHLPFTEQLYLTADETRDFYNGGMPLREGSPGDGALYVVRPDQWWAMGGNDNRFGDVWGGDDASAVSAAQALTSLHRHPGVVLSLHHADERRPIGAPEWQPNSDLARRYVEARNDPAAMRSLIAERSA